MANTGARVDTPAVKYRVGFVLGAFLTGGAIFLDSLCVFLMLFVITEVVSKIIKFIAEIGSVIIFGFLGVNFLQRRSLQKIGVAGVTTVIGELPFIGSLTPTLTIDSLSLIYLMRKEDREDAKKMQEKASAAATQKVTAQGAYQAVATRRAQQLQQAANDNEAAANDNEQDKEKTEREVRRGEQKEARREAEQASLREISLQNPNQIGSGRLAQQTPRAANDNEEREGERRTA